MQAFRTPFSAATCSRQEIGGVSLKVLLVVAQLPDFPLSKFPEIKVFGKACDGRTIDLGASKSKFLSILKVALVGWPVVPTLPAVVGSRVPKGRSPRPQRDNIKEHLQSPSP